MKKKRINRKNSHDAKASWNPSRKKNTHIHTEHKSSSEILRNIGAKGEIVVQRVRIAMPAAAAAAVAVRLATIHNHRTLLGEPNPFFARALQKEIWSTPMCIARRYITT